MTDHRATKTFLLVYLLSSLAMSGLAAAQPDARRADVDDSYLRYVHPTIREPFVDLVNLSL